VISSGTGVLAPVGVGLVEPIDLSASTGTPGPHDFAVRVVLFVRAKITLQHRHVHRIPHPTFVTIAKRPS
jgi:hypothetical protein